MSAACRQGSTQVNIDLNKVWLAPITDNSSCIELSELTLNRTYASDQDLIIAGAAESMASKVSDDNKRLALSVMLAVSDVPTAGEWYRRALGAVELWSMGGVEALQIAGAPFCSCS